ncbi:uncharacterized protein LOC122313665 [Carya illinoinensis]|uniref:uncharacterized protein LOC122313665 n=1 Tax=Carya illinoinensis TaxID=32201 RepID=UPI001C71A113|nr:uncharacterized protein LOC122313665 [Carya illinoinensis]
MAHFREALDVSELYDIGWCGDKFTWSNRHSDETFTKECLDRAVANSRWNGMYLESSLEVMTSRCFDHRPILLHCKRPLSSGRVYRNVFKYEAYWALEEECGIVIKAEWKKGIEGRESVLKVQGLLKSCSQVLGRWSKQCAKDRGKEIKEMTERLKQLQVEEGGHNTMEIKRFQEEMGLLMDQEDLKWKQRAKKNWYQRGDRNTKYFYACATQRRRKNLIKQIYNSQNRLVHEPVYIYWG